MMIQVSLKNKKRFEKLCQFQKTIVLNTNVKYKSNKVFAHKSVFSNYNCRLCMFLKRYFHKLFVDSNREKNVKVKFQNDMYLLECYDEFKPNVLSSLKRLGMEINGVVISKKYYDQNYQLIIKSGFQIKNMIILLLLSLIKLFSILITIKNYITIK